MFDLHSISRGDYSYRDFHLFNHGGSLQMSDYDNSSPLMKAEHGGRD